MIRIKCSKEIPGHSKDLINFLCLILLVCFPVTVLVSDAVECPTQKRHRLGLWSLFICILLSQPMFPDPWKIHAGEIVKGNGHQQVAFFPPSLSGGPQYLTGISRHSGGGGSFMEVQGGGSGGRRS